MSGPVMWSATPVSTENLMSLVTRTGTKNFLPSSHVLLQQVGCPHAQNPSAALNPDLNESLLAEILRQPVAEVARRRCLPLADRGFVNSFGAAVRADEFVISRRRFGPSAIGISPHIRAIWSLKVVPCCTERWQYLIDACACGAVQRWQAANHLDRCDVCNAPLSDAPANKVGPELRDGLGFLIGLLDPDEARRSAARAQLPTVLADWNSGMVFQLALAIMPATQEGYTPRRGHEPPAADLTKYTASLAQAADIVRGWPNAFVAALTERLKERAISKRNVRYKGPLHYLSSLASDLLPTIVVEAFDEALAPIGALPGATPPDQIGMREAAQLTGQEEYKLATARRADQLTTRICLRSGRLLPMLDRQEIETLHDFLTNRIGPERASYQLHLPQYAIVQLACEGLITLNDHPYIISSFGNRQLHKTELARFRQRLQDAASPPESIEEPMPLHRAARAIGGGPKPWGIIFKSMIEGRISYSVKGNAVDQITISARDANALRTISLSQHAAQAGPKHLSQRDAAEILNLNMKRASLLPGVSNPGGAHKIDWRRVCKLARTRVTLAELSARTGINGARLEARLGKDGCPRHDALGWMRRKALALIETY